VEASANGRFDRDRYFIQQRIRLMINQYEVYGLGDDGRSPGEPVCFVEQKRMALKEDLRVFTDDTKSAEVFRFKARQVWDPRAVYSVTDPQGKPIGGLQKVFGKSLLRSTWRLLDPSGSVIGWAQERSLGVALFRRLVGFVPYLGDFADWLPIRYHFDYYLGAEDDDGPRVGGLERLVSFRDRYVFDLAGDEQRAIDRRLAVALAVGMDALQAR
jgi:uncharacterized protein YxjI